MRTRAVRWRQPDKKSARGTLASLSGGPAGSKHLPWDDSKITRLLGLVPVAANRDCESACGKAAVGPTSLGTGINGTARTLNASNRCADGKLPSVSSSGESVPRFASNERPQSDSAEPVSVSSAVVTIRAPPTDLMWITVGTPTARGHAREGILHLSATAWAATRNSGVA